MRKYTMTIEAEILRNRRLDLDLSQQDVANMCHIELRQYQRLEYGEVSLSRTSMSIGLDVCRALKLNPFLFARK